MKTIISDMNYALEGLIADETFQERRLVNLNNFEKEEKGGISTLPDFETYQFYIGLKTKIEKWNRIESTEIYPHIAKTPDFQQNFKDNSGKK